MMKKMLTLLMASLLIASTVSVKAVCSDDGAAAVGLCMPYILGILCCVFPARKRS